MNIPNYKLTLVTRMHDTPLDDYLAFIQHCAQSGISALQLREKQLPYHSLLQLGRQIKSILAPFNIPLIINDHLDIAIELDAEGIHLGQSDGCPITARQRLGSEKIIGLSIDSLENLHLANNLPIDYVGVGAIFPTQNKPNVTTLWGTDGLRKISPVSKHPIIAIGGINESNAEEVLRAGAQGIAVIGAVHNSKYPTITIKKLCHILDHQGKHHV